MSGSVGHSEDSDLILADMGNRWRVLSQGVIRSDSHFDKISLACP